MDLKRNVRCAFVVAGVFFQLALEQLFFGDQSFLNSVERKLVELTC